MGLFDLFKKKKQTKVVKIEEKTPTQTSTPKISPTTTKKEIQLYPTKPFNVDYNTHWVKETLKTIPTYTKNYREGFRGIPKSLVSDEQFEEFWIDYCEVYHLLDEEHQYHSKGYNVEQIHKEIKSYCSELKSIKYDSDKKEWIEVGLNDLVSILSENKQEVVGSFHCALNVILDNPAFVKPTGTTVQT